MAPSNGEFAMLLARLTQMDGDLRKIDERMKNVEMDSAERRGATRMIQRLCVFLGLSSMTGWIALATFLAKYLWVQP